MLMRENNSDKLSRRNNRHKGDGDSRSVEDMVSQDQKKKECAGYELTWTVSTLWPAQTTTDPRLARRKVVVDGENEGNSLEKTAERRGREMVQICINNISCPPLFPSLVSFFSHVLNIPF